MFEGPDFAASVYKWIGFSRGERLLVMSSEETVKKPLNKCRAPEHDAKQQVIGYHPLSAWETSGSTLGSMPVRLFRTPTENHLLGVKPRILVCFMQTRLLPARGSSIQTITMNGQRQAQIPEMLPQAPCPAMNLVGMDLHSEKVQLCLTLWQHGSDPVQVRSITTTLAALETTYRKQIPADALTVMEASGNAFATVRRLKVIGWAAKVLPSDIATGMAPPDRINDAIDAYNIAAAYARRGRRTEVWVPSPRYQDHRALWHAYNNAVKDAACQRNRIWGLFNGHGIALRHVTSPKSLRKLLKDSEELGDEARFLIGLAIDDLERDLESKETIRKQIGRIVALTPAMRTAMSVMGIGQIGAFALVAYIEDVQRFPTAKKLCSYFGFKPVMAESGTDTGSKHLSKRGNPMVKALLIESAQSAMRYGRQPMHKWACRLRARGKAYNLAVSALARKMLTALWHTLMGHPVPSCEAEMVHVRKVVLAARCLDKEHLARLGHANATAFALAVTRDLYAHMRTMKNKGDQSTTESTQQISSLEKESKINS